MSQQLLTLEDKALLVGWDTASVANRWCQWVAILELLLMMMMMMMQNTTTHDTARPSRTLICRISSDTRTRWCQSVRRRAWWSFPWESWRRSAWRERESEGMQTREGRQATDTPHIESHYQSTLKGTFIHWLIRVLGWVQYKYLASFMSKQQYRSIIIEYRDDPDNDIPDATATGWCSPWWCRSLRECDAAAALDLGT